MSFTAKDVLSRASIVMNDGASVRWPLPELLGWLNDGVREISVYKPSATAITASLSLVEGTKQTLPATYHSLLAVIRNTSSGRAITPISKDVLNRQITNWHDDEGLAQSKDVVHVVDDDLDPATFWVVPGNDGEGSIDVVVAKNVVPIAVPANPLLIESYSATVDLNDIWQNALLDYILYRAFSKDVTIPGVAQRASAHYTQFANAIGMKQQVETAFNPNTTAGSRASPG